LPEFYRPASLERRNRILDAGLKLALSHGVRATTMEALAREAGVAKPTLYSYFPDKMALYRAITQRLFVELEGLVLQALNGPGDVSSRVAGALIDKHCRVFCLLEGSDHANEIYSEKGRFAAKEVEWFEHWLKEEMAAVLREDGHKQALEYALLLIACSEGIARRAMSKQQIASSIELVCKKLLA